MAAKVGKTVWTGRVLTFLISALFLFSGIMKFVGGQEVTEGMEKMGLPQSLLIPVAVLELTCVVIYLIPPTTILGAILLTGYLGGAILTHLRVGEPVIAHVVIGVLVWLGPFLRDERLRVLIPWRR